MTGRARYAYEYEVDRPAYAWVVQARIGKGRVLSIDTAAVVGRDGVLEVLWHGNAPRLADVGDATLHVLQTDEVAYRGQAIGLVVAETAEAAREAAGRLEVEYDVEAHDAVLTSDHPTLYSPGSVNAGYETDSFIGDAAAAFAASDVQVDATYTTPAEHNNPMEPHATTAVWDGDRLRLYDSNQGGQAVRVMVAKAFSIDAGAVDVISAHVGGGFGSKGMPRPNVMLAAMAARVVGRPVRLALTRQQQFSLVGYRTPTIQRLQLGATSDGVLNAIAHDVVEQTATLKEFAEQSALITRMMYAAPHRRTTHRLARLDVPVPSWMRAPGECPGSFALESAMDELAVAASVDPIELRIRNEPAVHPEDETAWSSRMLVQCLQSGADRFGWAGRDPRPGRRIEVRWLVGTGVAASTYPVFFSPATARVGYDGEREFTVSINATDIGTGARTALMQVAADALGAPPEQVTILIGDTSLPRAGVAGGSMGMGSWGWAVSKAASTLAYPARRGVRRRWTGRGHREHRRRRQGDGAPATPGTPSGRSSPRCASTRQSGEIRVPRMVGVFAAGRIVNAATARSQFIGGMTMGLSMALHEEGLMDAEYGDYANHDLATYHVPVNADVVDIDVSWLDEHDPHLGATGTKGIGELGIVGTAAAIANAVYHATGTRLRDLPLRLDRLLPDQVPTL